MNRKLEILGRYLSSGIEVACCLENNTIDTTGVIREFNTYYKELRVTVGDNKYGLSEWPIDKVKPLLLTFEDLVKKQPDGTVPAVEIANMAWSHEEYKPVIGSILDDIVWVHYRGAISEYRFQTLQIDRNFDLKISYGGVDNQSQIQHYLVKLGFATPLSDGTPLVEGSDFVRKTI